MNRSLKVAALTAALSAAALVSTPVTAFAAESHGRPVALHCDSCRLPGHSAPDRGHDDRRGTDENHRGIIADRGVITENRGVIADRGVITENRGVIADRRDRRRDRSIVVEVSNNVGPLVLRSQRPGSDWPGALHTGSSVVRVRSNDNADYRALRNAGSVQIVVRGNHTECDAQGHLRCSVQGSSVVRIFRY
ncbi:hypothetical protein [Actinospica robiniae]|uniref:hypothetical protein n=1 Tax=Actinospica robiniae TaxID=304901 RepID=UPI0003F55584|nr:hypothetical protein [Actinospica robiniae]